MRWEAGPRTLWGASAGLGGIALVVGACYGDDTSATVPALALLVPIGVASLLAGWCVGVVVAVVAALAYALAFLPPIGHVRIGLTTDVEVLVAFVVVAVLVSLLADRRRAPAPREELLDEQRAMLLRGVSHDLRSPLHTIRSVSSDLLAGDTYDDTTRRSLLGLVADESERLDRIVGNLLSISRVQSGTFAPELAPEALEPILTVGAGRLARTVPSARIVVRVEPGLPEVRVDAVQIDQVLTNLLENALRVTPPGAEVVVAARALGRAEVEVSVVDHGPGFGPARRRRRPAGQSVHLRIGGPGPDGLPGDRGGPRRCAAARGRSRRRGLRALHAAPRRLSGRPHRRGVPPGASRSTARRSRYSASSISPRA